MSNTSNPSAEAGAPHGAVVERTSRRPTGVAPDFAFPVGRRREETPKSFAHMAAAA
jgi:hypothetical protein